LALAIKEKKLAREIVGVSRRKSTIKRAAKEKIVDFATLDLKEGVRDSDFVIIAAPVLKIVKIAEMIAPFLKKGAIVTDAGSTKRYIVESIEKIGLKAAYFAGSHPIAGSEKSGIKYADKDLFKGACCIITDTRNTDREALGRIKRFWKALEMKVIIMPLDRHDRLLSKLSHLPHAVSVSLVNSAGRKDIALAAGGFRDTTRIASGEPGLWNDIFLTNRENLIKDIRVFKKELSKIETALKNNNGAHLLKLLSNAKSIRDSL
jgi:prephenate dehydrogenase